MTVPTAPAGVFLGEFSPGSPAWEAARAGLVITATEIPAVLGLSPWQSRFSLYHRKAGLPAPPFQTNEAMEWGVRLEDAVASKFHDTHPEWLPMPAGTWRSSARPWQVATPDRLLYPITDASDWTGAADLGGEPTAVLEVKTSPQGEGWGDAGSDDIPVYYRAQVLWQLDVLGLETAHVAVLIGGCDYREYEVKYDAAEAEVMREAAADFLDDVATGRRPPIDGSDATYQTLRRQPDGVEDDAVEISAALANRYTGARTAETAATEETRLVRGLLLDAMGPALRAECATTPIAYRTVHPDGTTRALMPAPKKKDSR